jgi:F0F1-type ATP synthase gamma subunit
MSNHFKEQLKNTIETMIMADIYLISKPFLQDINNKLQAKMEEKSQNDLKKANYVLAIKSDRAIIGNYNSNVSSSINNSSNLKQNKSKGKKTAINEVSNDEDLLEIIFMDKTTLVKELKEISKDISGDLLDALVEHFLKYFC